MAIRQPYIDRLLSYEKVASRVAEIRKEVGPLIASTFSGGNFNYDEQKNLPMAASKVSPELQSLAVFGRLTESFFRAAEEGDVILVLAYLLEGFPANYQNEKTGETALHIAAAVNAVDVVRVLVSIGNCDYLLRDKRDRLAVELAISEADNWAIAKLLGKKSREQGKIQGVSVTRRSIV